MKMWELSDNEFVSDCNAVNWLLSNSGNGLLVAPAGSGKSYAVLKHLMATGEPFVFAADTIALATQLAHQFDLPVHHAGSRVEGANQLITIYDHVPGFQSGDKLLLVDEFHSLIADYSPTYRLLTLRRLINALAGYRQVLGLTATPIVEPYEWRLARCSWNRPAPQVDLVSFRSTFHAVVGEILAHEGDRHFISVFDKSPKVLLSLLESHGIGSDQVVLINSETLPGLDGDVLLKGKFEKHTRVVICTYRQGFSLRDPDFRVHIVPQWPRHTPLDILQVSQRFRNGVACIQIYANLAPGFGEERLLSFDWFVGQSLKHARGLVPSLEPHWRRFGRDWMVMGMETGHLTGDQALLLNEHGGVDEIGVHHAAYRQRGSAVYADDQSFEFGLMEVGLALGTARKAEEISCHRSPALPTATQLPGVLQTIEQGSYPAKGRGRGLDEVVWLYGQLRSAMDPHAATEVMVAHSDRRRFNALREAVHNRSSTAEARMRILNAFPVGDFASAREVLQRVQSAGQAQEITAAGALAMLRAHASIERSTRARENVWVIKSHDPLQQYLPATLLPKARLAWDAPVVGDAPVVDKPAKVARCQSGI